MIEKLRQLWGNAFFVTLMIIFALIAFIFLFSIFSVMGTIFFNAYNQATQGFLR